MGDTNKGDKDKPKIRSRLVAQELNRFKCPELFAATPPIEFIRYLISRCASSQWTTSPTRIMVNDVKKAYFNAPATRRVFVALPPEDVEPGEENMCALLKKSLYGTPDAAYNWTEAYTKALMDLGFTKGESSPCSFRHAGRGICTIVHGDDFCSEGAAKDLQWMKQKLSENFEIKTEVLGPNAGAGEVQELRFLNRIMAWTEHGITWEADPRHAELVIQQLDLENCKPVVSPGVKEDNRERAADRIGSTEDRAPRTDEPAPERRNKPQDASRHARKAKPNDIDNIMGNAGWEYTPLGSFVKNEEGVVELSIPLGIRSGRRIVRNRGNGEHIDELSFNHRTSNRRKLRQLRAPTNVVQEMYIDEVSKDNDDDEKDMPPRDASL